MIQSSEWVSTGHPDKLADYIVSYLLDRYLEHDKFTRFAVECQIKDRFVTLGGEITSKASFTESEIEQFVRDAVNHVGYNATYKAIWGGVNTICGDDIVLTSYIGQQSTDIAQGVDSGGWGDNGIFWGMATNTPETDFMPRDWWLAREIGLSLAHKPIGNATGIDVKTLVMMNDGNVSDVIVSIPMLSDCTCSVIERVKTIAGPISRVDSYYVYVNGTGRFVKHGPIADCGTTGRKLAVDFYGGNCRIGGGAPWSKDGTKADLTLNIFARAKALEYIRENPSCPEVHCAVACRIGSPYISVTLFDRNMNEITHFKTTVHPDTLIQEYGLRNPVFANLCMNGLFSCL